MNSNSILKLQIILGNQYNPYINLAIESQLLDEVHENCIRLFLWKNKQTVVIGANQNPYSECDVDSLIKEGGHLSRRRTGGGAVYHDLGNLNFSFVADKKNYNVKRQMQVIQKALMSFGLETEVSGRNDITYQGRKFSGNAFAFTKHQGLHHGTILIKTDSEKLQRYLKVKPAKLHKHGVKSVASRVINLSEVADINSENIIPHLIIAFEEVYQNKAEMIDFNSLCTEKALLLSKKISSDDYLYGKWKFFNAKKTANFEWGNIELDINIDEEKRIIRDISIASDSLDPESIETAANILKGASLDIIPQYDTNNIIIKNIVEIIF